jgi:hypothetical protein
MMTTLGFVVKLAAPIQLTCVPIGDPEPDTSASVATVSQSCLRQTLRAATVN